MASRRKSLPARVLEDSSSRGLFEGCSRVLAAVSGGADSMALMSCLIEIRAALGISLAVGHVDHGLRRSSANDAEFVRDAASRAGLPSAVRRVDVRGEVRQTGDSIEDAARRLRYATLAEMAAEVGAEAVATGHTATDQAETVLMRLVRGTGPAGLAGIRPARADMFRRPLLCTTRDEVRRHVDRMGIGFREDESNRDERFLRNRIRIRLLPLLREMNPRIEFALAALAEDSAVLADHLSRASEAFIEAGETGEVAIPRGVVEKCPRVLLPHVVLAAFERAAASPHGLSRTHVEAVLRVLQAGGGESRELHLPQSVVAVARNGGCVLKPGHLLEPVQERQAHRRSSARGTRLLWRR